MNDTERYRLLHGPYAMPSCRLGDKLFCEIRGWVPVRRITDAPIPWPQTIVKRSRAFIVCGDLVKAIRLESAIAICHHWGVTPQTVTKWRKALGVPQINEGTARLYKDYSPEKLPEEIRVRAQIAANSPEANRKKAASRLGKPAPPNTLAALSNSWGKSPSPETRHRMSAAHKLRGTRPPKAGRPWTAEENALLGTIPDAELATRTGRTLSAVCCQRQRLRIPSFRRKGRKMLV